MGGHGALTIAFKNPTEYAAVSAFAPIVNPSAVPWGKKATSPVQRVRTRSFWSQVLSSYLQQVLLLTPISLSFSR